MKVGERYIYENSSGQFIFKVVHSQIYCDKDYSFVVKVLYHSKDATLFLGGGEVISPKYVIVHPTSKLVTNSKLLMQEFV